jgi:hypothetical protein
MTDVDEIQPTRGEKLLAAVLAVFVLIGFIWAYDRLDRRDDVRPPVPTAAERAVIEQEFAAGTALTEAVAAAADARDELELARERYRTALDAGSASPALRRAYVSSERRFAAAEREVAAARAEVARVRPPAEQVRREQAAELERRADRAAWLTFGLRLALAVVALAAALAAFTRLRGSRYLPVAGALVAAATVLALVLAGDYLDDYVDWRDLGPLVLSLIGIALTLLAFVALQRYLARRIPLRRVRKGECPYCGFPVRGAEHCEGCGRTVVAPCASCAAPRRVGTAFCGICGRA